MTAPSSIDVPDGYVEIPMPPGYNSINGPFWGRRVGDDLVLGFRVEDRHANVRGTCHGGMLMLFADLLLPLAARYQADLDDVFLSTVNLTGDFLASPQVGDWVHGRAEVVRVTRNLVFTHGVVAVDDAPMVRVNGIFKRMGAPKDPDEMVLDLRAMFGPLRGTAGRAP